MRIRRWVPALVAAALLPALLVPTASAATAAPAEAPQSFGRDPAERGPAQFRGPAWKQDPPPRALPAKPRNDVLVDAPVNPDDASLFYNLIPYHEFAPRLRALQASPRVSVEVIGQSVQGRDLHLAVVTSPMTDAQWAEWQRLSDLRTADPQAAVALFRAGGYADWKTPIFINNNIHGNEWEGTDSTFQVLEELAFADDAAVRKLVDEHVLVFVISQNPDGRVNASRANANGFDMNRDFITASQPEVRIVRQQLIRYNPITMLDLHGYVSPTLIEPATGPHGENYEYDLYIRHALRNALAMEERILADVGADLRRTITNFPNRIDIPYRNRLSGWDDWPPIFTPMYAIHHGAIGHTIEVPLNPRGIANQAQRFDRTRINTAVGRAAIEASIDWTNANQDAVLGDQLEMFRRGAAGESSRPIDDPLALELGNRGTFQGQAVDNRQTFEQDYPRAYVIPAGDRQRSATAAARVVDFLLANDVAVTQTRTPLTIGGVRYPAGSYVVDMHQAKRGLANTILDTGRDVTPNFPTMYDISAWSQADLWGATVDTVTGGTLDARKLVPIGQAARTGSVVPGNRSEYVLTVDSAAGVRAVNDLVRSGVGVKRLSDGTFVVAGNIAAVRGAADRHGVAFDKATAAQAREARTAAPFTAFRIGFAGPADELAALTSLGFEVTPVTNAGFAAGTYRFADFDALYVASTAINPLTWGAAVEAEFSAWAAGGGAVVGRGGNGVTFNTRAGLLPVTATAGRGDANGIVAVTNDPASPITGDAPDRSFVTSPRFFSSVGAGVRVDQRLATDGFFLAGHWIGQEAAAGQPVVVSGSARGAAVTLFGTEPLYRQHPEGLFPQVAEALWQ